MICVCIITFLINNFRIEREKRFRIVLVVRILQTWLEGSFVIKKINNIGSSGNFEKYLNMKNIETTQCSESGENQIASTSVRLALIASL